LNAGRSSKESGTVELPPASIGSTPNEKVEDTVAVSFNIDFKTLDKELAILQWA